MDSARWAAVDDYLAGLLLPEDPSLDAALRASEEAGLPAIQVPPNLGRFLQLLAVVRGARRILEVGTLGGYSTIWLARALPPDGRLVSLELEQAHADVATGNLRRAGVADRATVRVGPALDSFRALIDDGVEPFDLVFIDADKEHNADYFALALEVTRPGSLIVVDNVVRGGAVVEADNPNAAVQGTRRLFDAMAGEERVQATALQTVGVKGYDGFALALVVGR